MARITKATFLAGLLSGLVAPLAWPFVVLLINGSWPTWSIYPMAALSISSFTIIIATPCSVVIGGATLFLLEKYDLNTLAITGLLGLITALLIYFLLAGANNYPSLSQSWPLAAFFAVIGLICGVVACYLSRSNNALKMDRANRAAL